MKQIFPTFLLTLFLVGPVFAQSDLQPVAIVRLTKSEPITVKQFKTEVERMQKARGQALSVAERRQLLDVMINEKLALQAAERDKITLSENEINQQLTELRTRMAQATGRQPTDAEFAAAIMNETGLDMTAFREQLRRQILIQKYLLSKKQDILQAIKIPTEAEILETYTLAKAQFVRPETVRFSMIQVPYGADAAAKAKAWELAARLARDIGSNPSKFDEAVIRAQAQGSGYQGGDGGYLPRNLEAQQMLGSEFMTVAFTLKQGEVSKVVEGLRGYHIIKITETYDQKNLELDDIAQLGSRMTVRDFIGNRMLQDRQQAVLAKASQELVTELRVGNPFQIFENNLNW